jgi:D-glycero-D-manno-heptose 1,7-bisphosphate phosphatase
LSKRAVFLDRDGTIIPDRHYLDDPEGVELLPSAAEAIRMLNGSRIPAIVVTNQSGIARGLFDERQLELIHERLAELLSERGAAIDRIYFCPHHPRGTVERYAISCTCRKPEPGLLKEAARDFGLDLAACYMVGDKPLDMETIHRVGGKGILVGAEPVQGAGEKPDFRARDLFEAIRWILRDMEK